MKLSIIIGIACYVFFTNILYFDKLYPGLKIDPME